MGYRHVCLNLALIINQISFLVSSKLLQMRQYTENIHKKHQLLFFLKRSVQVKVPTSGTKSLNKAVFRLKVVASCKQMK